MVYFKARSTEGEPAWHALPPDVPAYVGTMLGRCLEKEAPHRLSSIGEARLALEQPAAERGAAATGGKEGPGSTARDRRYVVAALAALVVIAAAGFAMYRWLDRPRTLALETSRQLTTHAAIEEYPTISPDGRTIAFESNQAGDWDIWVTTVAGGAPVNRTSDHRGDDRYPSWSPDGSRIAFWSSRSGGGFYVMPAVGGAPSRIVGTGGTGPAKLSPAVWSPDGSELGVVAFTASGSAMVPALHLTNLQTRSVRTVPLPGTEESRLDLAWSPDGERLAYIDAAQQPSETGRLRVLRLSDGMATDVTDARANARSPRWAPDGRSVYFVWNKSGAADLWQQRFDRGGALDGAPARLTTGLEVRHAALTAAGDRLVIAKGRWVANVWRVPLGLGRPATWDDAEQVTFEHAFIEFIDVSPDGNTLAFSSDRAGNQDLWTLDLRDKRAMQLTSHEAPEWAPRWSSDGTRLAFYASRTGDREIYVMDAGGGNVRQLTSVPGLDATPDWSPDDHWLAFRSERNGSSDIWVVSLDGRQQRVIAPHPAPEYAPTWSPDGRWLAFGSGRDRRGQLWRVPFPDGPPQPITQGGTFSLRWSRADGQLYYLGREDDSAEIWSIDPIEPGRPIRITQLAGRRGSLVGQPPCPASGVLYFAWREDLSDIWVMEVAMK